MQRYPSLTSARARYATAILLCCTWTLDARADTAVSEDARVHFRAGVAHLKSSNPERYGDAYREFKAAYAASPSWKILGNLGITADKLERDGEAIDALQGYLDQGKAELGPEEATQVRLDLERLRGGIAIVKVKSTSSGHFTVVDTRTANQVTVVNTYGPFDGSVRLRVRPGRHEFQVAVGERDASTWAVTLVAGDVVEQLFPILPPGATNVEPDEASVPSEPPTVEASARSQLPAYVMWSAGGVAAVATALIFVKAQSVQGQANNAFRVSCPDGADRPIQSVLTR